MKSIRTRVALAGAILVGISALSIAFVAGGSAEVPPSGVLCQADGKISGRGATFQARAQAAFIAGFNADICGNVPDNPSNPGTPPAPAGNNMVEYNLYDPSGAAVLTGSGYGRKAMACRTDAFAGTDVPYGTNQLQALDTSVASTVILGSGNTCQSSAGSSTTAGTAFGTSFFPPFPPQDTSGANSSYPASGDQVAPLMSFPVAGSAVAVISFLTGGTVGSGAICQNATSAKPTTLSLTGAQVSLLFGGDIQTWNDSRLTTNNPALNTDNCSGPVTRVVRLDDSGTTQIFKTYLKNVDPNRTAGGGETCDTGTVWSTLFSASPNTTWPGFVPNGTAGQHVAATSTCSAIQNGDVNGNNGVLDECIGNTGGGNTITAAPGSVCYADLPDFRHFSDAAPNGGGHGGVPGCSPCTDILASVQNAALSGFVSPVNVTTANCNFGTLSVPGGSSGAVGLTTGTAFTPPNPIPSDWDTWATDNPSGEHGDVTNTGTQYPICGVTFGLVYTGLADGTVANAITGLTNDQRRTLYSYFSYVLSSAGQSQLTTNFYQSLPTSLLGQIRPEFQRNF